MTDQPATTPRDGSARPLPPTPPFPGRPNYAARRMLVSTFAIVAVVAAGVVGWRVLVRDGGGDDRGSAGTWDEIALVDRATGVIETIDERGEPIERFDLAAGLRRIEVEADRLALVGIDAITLTDVERDETPMVVPIELGSSVTRLAIDDRLVLAVGRPSGGNVLIVDGTTGATIDIGGLAGQSDPLLFAGTIRADHTGTRFAIGDARNFQTIVVAFDAEEPAYFPDQPLAVGDGIVATSQVVGGRAEIGLYDLEGRRIATAPTEIPAGAVFDGDELVVVSTDGAILRLGKGDDEAEEIGRLAVPAGSRVVDLAPAHDGDRLVVIGDVFEAVVDLDGATVFTTTFATPVDVLDPHPEWRCLPVGGGTTFHSIVSIATGEQLADLTGLEVGGVASDGCSVIGERDGDVELVTRDGTVRIGAVRSAALGPDGRTVVVTSSSGSTELLRIDDELTIGDPVVVRASTPATLEVAFLDR